MKRLKQFNRTIKGNVWARPWLLCLVIVMLGLSNVAALHLLTSPTAQLQSSITPPSKFHLLNPQKSGLLESTLPKSSKSAKTTSTNMEEGELNLTTHKSEAFEGYNIFVLEKTPRTRTDPHLKIQRSLIVINMKGEVIRETEFISFPPNTGYFQFALTSVKFINSTTLLFGTKKGATLWNIYDNTTVNLGFWGDHEYEYNPLNNTFFAFKSYVVEIDGTRYEFEQIVEYNTTGHVIWCLDPRSFISHRQWCPFRDMVSAPSGPIVDLLHSNSIFFDSEEDVLYYHARNLNTFYKIDHKTGKVLWGLGEYGNFTLFNQSGKQRRTLFYHAHAVEKVDENTFILFDNDYHNQTNPLNRRSRILEITIDGTTMTANESWVWNAPSSYYSFILGDADRLPNGNRLGVFGTPWHLEEGNDPIGARLVEVNDVGQIVWELNFPNNKTFFYRVYRIERFRLTPILNSLSDIRALTQDDVTVSWQTWYNFRTTRRMRGIYTLYLNGEPIERGPHVFDKFWRPTNLTLTLGTLDAGSHNCTLVLADEAGHRTTDSLTIFVIKTFYIEREGPLTIELGLENARIHWNGETPNPLLATLTSNNSLVDSFVWNGSVITLDLNSFEVGTYLVALNLFNNTELIYEDRFLTTIYPATAPRLLSFPTDQSLTWNESIVLFWEIFDYFPASWGIFVNNTRTAWGSWETPNYLLAWSVPVLDEGLYNVTLAAYDRISHRISTTTWLTVVPPKPPVITTVPQQHEIQWGQKNAILRWEVHGGSRWTLWKNGTGINEGAVTNIWIEVPLENWSPDWSPGKYNLTLQVTDEDDAVVMRTTWIRIWVNPGDAYADSLIPGVSMWYRDGENALGPPDGKYAHLYVDYGNGHVTLDMGLNEEVLDGKGDDFMVYARGGEYALFVGNNLSVQLLVGNQVAAPLVLLGTGFGNTNFSLESTDLDQVRYLQIVSLTDEEVKLDAVMAIYYNQPPRPASIYERWRVPILGGMAVLFAMVVLLVRKRKDAPKTP